jgi:hypothetical protein
VAVLLNHFKYKSSSLVLPACIWNRLYIERQRKKQKGDMERKLFSGNALIIVGQWELW